MNKHNNTEQIHQVNLLNISLIIVSSLKCNCVLSLCSYSVLWHLKFLATKKKYIGIHTCQSSCDLHQPKTSTQNVCYLCGSLTLLLQMWKLKLNQAEEATGTPAHYSQLLTFKHLQSTPFLYLVLLNKTVTRPFVLTCHNIASSQPGWRGSSWRLGFPSG